MSNTKKREIEKEEAGEVSTTEDGIESKKPKIDTNVPLTVNKYMPLKNQSLKAQSSFKSPLMNRRAKNAINQKQENEDLDSLVCSLEEKLKVVEEEISNLEKENYSTLELDSIIKKLHDYNEIKDIAQILMGKIADIKCVTIREIHKDFNADIEDE